MASSHSHSHLHLQSPSGKSSCSSSIQQISVNHIFCHAAGRKDLVTAVHRCGGFQAVASYLGAMFQETRGRPVGSRGAQAAKPTLTWL